MVMNHRVGTESQTQVFCKNRLLFTTELFSSPPKVFFYFYFLCLVFACMHVCVHMCMSTMCVTCTQEGQSGHQSPETGVAGGCESLYGAGDQIQTLWKNGQCF